MGAKTEGVERSIREMIAAGEFGPGGRLPSERRLVAQFGVGRTTVRLVLLKLSAEGLVRSEHGRGYFVVGAEDEDPSSE